MKHGEGMQQDGNVNCLRRANKRSQYNQTRIFLVQFTIPSGIFTRSWYFHSNWNKTIQDISFQSEHVVFNFKDSYIGGSRCCSWWWGSRWKSSGDVSVLASNSQNGCGDDSDWKETKPKTSFYRRLTEASCRSTEQYKIFPEDFSRGSSQPAAASMNPNCHIALILC